MQRPTLASFVAPTLSLVSILFILCVCGIFIPHTVSAQATANTVEFVPLIPGGGPFDALFGEGSSLPGFFNSLFTLSITIGALLAVLMIAYGGWQYMTSEIGGKKDEAKRHIQNALLGLLMLLATVLILRQINPDIVSLNIFSNLTPVTVGTLSTTGGNLSTPPVTTPEGYCYTINPNSHANEYENYQCFSTSLACARVTGSYSACQAYGSALVYNISLDDQPLPALPENTVPSYSDTKWASSLLISSSVQYSPLNQCLGVFGQGWEPTVAQLCGITTTFQASNGVCCGYTAPSDAPASTEKEFKDTANLSAAENGSWCYQLTGGSIYCSVGKDVCEANRTARGAANPSIAVKFHCQPIN